MSSAFTLFLILVFILLAIWVLRGKYPWNPEYYRASSPFSSKTLTATFFIPSTGNNSDAGNHPAKDIISVFQ